MKDKMKQSYENINISEEAKERIQMAIKKENEKKPSWNNVLRKHSVKVAVAACATVCLAVPTGTYAANKIYQYFQSTVTKNDARVDIQINKPGTLKVEGAKPTEKTATASPEEEKAKGNKASVTPDKFVKITADFGSDYIGDKTSDEGAFQGYSHKGGFEEGKSFWYELLYMDGDKKITISSFDNEESEQIEINGRKAVYCKNNGVVGSQYNSENLTEYGQQMYILLEDYGYMIKMGAQRNLGKAQFIKLAEKIMISEAKSKKDAAGYELYTEDTKRIDLSDRYNSIKTEYYTDGTAKINGGTVKVTDVKVLDSAAGLDKKAFGEDDDNWTYNQLFEKDGKIKSYQREKVKNGDGITSPSKKVEKTETVKPKLVYVTAELENIEAFDDNLYCVPSLEWVTQEGKNIYSYDEDYNRPSYMSCALMDNMPCYIEKTLGGKSFYFTKLKDGKTIIHFAYLVDEDQLDGMALSLNDSEGMFGTHIYLDISNQIK